ncbi:MAG: LacI family DNA-binding transcriptional regulator [Sphaerochaetaceae bacterium]
MVTLKDISEFCGVSKSTVSKALNDQSDISKETTERIKEAAQKFGYLPNAAARSLKTNKTLNLGVLFVDKTSSGLRHEYFSGMLESIKSAAERKGYDITFISRNLGERKMSFYEHAKYRGCEGVVIASVDFTDSEVIKLVNSEIPTVTIDYVYDRSTAILSNNLDGMKQIAEYIFSKGHRRVAVIHGENTSVTQKRMASFRNTCNKIGLEIDESLIKEAHYHDPKLSALATKELLDLENKPTCIIYPDDFSYIGGMNIIEHRGFKVPDDISVVGYDGILLSQMLRPKLTTYKQDSEEIGKIAVEKLIAEIEEPRLSVPEIITVTGKLLEGGTVKEI